MNVRTSVSLVIVAVLLAGLAVPGNRVEAQAKKGKKAAAATLAGAKWIWAAGDAGENAKAFFRKEFPIPADVGIKASIIGSADNHLNVYINGQQVLASDSWEQPVTADVTKHIRTGPNVIAVAGRNDGGPAGVIVKLELEFAGNKVTVATDESWQSSASDAQGWMTAGFDAKTWKAATVIAAYGGGAWGALPKNGGGGAGGPVPGVISAPEGFKVEKIYEVPKNDEGSWVSIAALPDGRLVASDQGNKGLYYITPPPLGKEDAEAKVVKVPADVSNAQGMVWAFGALYVNRNGGGLWRVTDSDNNGDLDKAEPVVPLQGGGEHGPHAVIVTEDGKGLYIVGGNHTPIPSDLTGTKQPRNWGEDHLLPRQWDARGHARGILAPGGWVCRVSPDGKERVLYSNGFRNEYDIALNREGEMFTFDSDMEWDFGTPWYRPTRVCHVTSGSEFGWRSGTGKWPTYYPDSLPPVVDIGPASPVGVLFGYGAKFPAQWENALYVLDWTYGTIWAVYLTPDGSSYKGELVEFISGAPLPVTDAVVGKDGAFYFAVGGRGTQSALYRVTYDGPIGAPAAKENPEFAKLRDIRHKLEAFHGVQDAKAVAAAWPYLGHADRHIRFAARIAIEHQPVEQWESKALAESDPQARITAMVALSRQGKPTSLGNVLAALGKLDLKTLPQSQLVEALRAYELAFIRLGKPDDAQRKSAIAVLDAIYPHKSDDANRELVQLLVYLDAPTVVEKTMQMMANLAPTEKPNWATVLARNGGYGGTAQAMLDNIPPLQGIHYAFALRNVRYGWTIPQREQYFKFINDASKHPGGASYGGFLTNIRNEALENCSPTERVALRHLTGENLTPPPPFAVKPVKGPGKMWTVQTALTAVGNGLSGRNFESGRNVFHAVGCVKCHRFDGVGGAVGPDVSSVGNKFSYNDLLEAIIEPSKVINDQYGSFVVETKDGDRYVGIVLEDTEKGTVEVYTQDFNSDPIRLKKSDVESKQPSPLSQMPQGLINVLNEDELKDLLAYLMSRGDKNASVFK